MCGVIEVFCFICLFLFIIPSFSSSVDSKEWAMMMEVLCKRKLSEGCNARVFWNKMTKTEEERWIFMTQKYYRIETKKLKIRFPSSSARLGWALWRWWWWREMVLACRRCFTQLSSNVGTASVFNGQFQLVIFLFSISFNTFFALIKLLLSPRNDKLNNEKLCSTSRWSTKLSCMKMMTKMLQFIFFLVAGFPVHISWWPSVMRVDAFLIAWNIHFRSLVIFVYT